MAEIGIGTTVWVFDSNSREYRHDVNGRAMGSPVYRKQWVPVIIVGENRASWLIGGRYDRFSKKLPHHTKSTPYGTHRVATSQAEVDDDCWVRGHGVNIAHMVMNCQDAATLKQIAVLVGYTPEEIK